MIALGAAWEFATSKVGGAVIGALAAVALLIAVYQAGAEGERTRGEAKTLRERLEVQERQYQTAIDIQTRLAMALSEVRVQNQQQGRQVDEMVRDFRKKSPGLGDTLSAADRVRLLSIRIGPSPAPAAR